ncbi:MAG: chemotaxis protein CheW [Kangiellaceae bacterium]|jgi:purine-binding chemotaxis protein CheW|nr:chemotaxis protein CheW [Kangiellaceae bacterium]
MSTEMMQVSDNLPAEVSDELALVEESNSQFLSFQLADETYCVDILTVSEIRGWQRPTHLPNSPSYIKGVINIRGDIIPIIDLREKFQVCDPQYTKSTVIIVLTTHTETKSRTVGVVVDSVSDVFDFNKKDIKEAPNSSGTIDARTIRGLCDIDDEIIVVLDVDVMLDLTEIEDYYRNLI